MIEVLTIVAAALAVDPQVIVGLGAAARTKDAVISARATWPAGGRALAEQELLARLVGAAKPREPDPTALGRMLVDAADREARFDSAGAAALRQEVLTSFDATLHWSPELRQAAFTAMLDSVAAVSADGQRERAAALAREAVRRFGGVRDQLVRYPPDVRAVLTTASEEVQRQARRRLEIIVDRPGRLVADGVVLGEVVDRLTVELPTGSYRLWLLDAQGLSSLPHPIELGEQGARLELDASLDALLDLDPVVSIRCESDCAGPLARLGRRLGATHVLGVHPDGVTGIDVEVLTGIGKPWRATPLVETSVSVLSPRPRFSPLYLVPLGGGQLAQDRPFFAGGYAAAELGLLVWHVLAWQKHRQALRDDDFVGEPDLRTRRNFTAGLLYGAVALGILEAVVVGIVTGQ